MRALPLLLILSLALTGCMSVPRQDFNPSANKQISKVALITSTNPDRVNASLIHHPGVSFGLIGGLIAAADQTTKTNRLNESLKNDEAGGVDLVGRMKEVYLDELGKSRYDIEVVEVEGIEPAELLENYSIVESDADAFLDTRLRYAGYNALYPNTPYVPSLEVITRMVDAKTQQVLYETTISYGERVAGVEGMVTLDHDPRFEFQGFEDLVANPERAREGLIDAASKVAQRIARDIQ